MYIRSIIKFHFKGNEYGRVISWKELLDIGRKESDKELDIRESHQSVNKACMYIYTSGTTGPPKGNSEILDLLPDHFLKCTL